MKNPTRRYYVETNKPNPELDTGPLRTQVHALFCQWAKSHYHRKDFVAAVNHEVSLILIEYLMAGSPQLKLDEIPPLSVLSLTPESLPTDSECKQPRHRFYDDEDNLNCRVSSDFIRRGLGALFGRWVAQNWLARDFMEAATDMARTVLHDYEIACGLGGLGGGKTGPEYLSTPYVPPRH